MRNPMTHRLKQLHIKMKTLKDKEASGSKLTQSEQAELEQLTIERDEVMISLVLPVYYQPSALA